MSLNRRAARRDSPEGDICRAAESLGAVVLKVSGVGLPDTLVLHEGRTYLVEVKRPGKSLTHAQALTFARITLTGVSVYVVETPEEVVAMLRSGEPGYPDTLVPWAPGVRSVDGQKKREHRPGYDRPAISADFCVTPYCGRSRLPGLTRCAMHEWKGKK